MNASATAGGTSPTSTIEATWTRFWLEPANPRPLAIIRMATALLALVLLSSYSADLDTWFGPDGMIPADPAAAWRSPWGWSLFDLTRSSDSLRQLFIMTAVVLMLLGVGLVTPVVSLAAPVLWASLLHRGPMLAGPADDCVAVLLWCLAIAPCGAAWSLDRWFRRRTETPQPSIRGRIALGLMQVHAAAISLASLLAQLKGDVWWDGTAAWWLAARAESRVVDLTGLFARSEYLCNLVTHGITLFEAVFAIGIWFTATQTTIARIGLVAWPLIGLLAGEPWWGGAMAIMCVGVAHAPSPDAR
ncbi:MAG: hypothetical protein WCC69_00330 [Pirellulales bacterium]